jgi:hypothetical protein
MRQGMYSDALLKLRVATVVLTILGPYIHACRRLNLDLLGPDICHQSLDERLKECMCVWFGCACICVRTRANPGGLLSLSLSLSLSVSVCCLFHK